MNKVVKTAVVTLVLAAAPLAVFAYSPGTPDTRTIHGTVIDVVSQKPVRGAAVYISNSSVNTRTNKKGNFKLVVSDTQSTNVLVFTRWYSAVRSLYVPAEAKQYYQPKIQRCKKKFARKAKLNKYKTKQGKKQLARRLKTCKVNNREHYNIYLSPDATPASMPLVYPRVKYTKSVDGGMYISGQVVDAVTGEGVRQIQVNSSHSSMNDRTNENGKFRMWTGATNSHRLYLMDADFYRSTDITENNYYQITVPYGYTANVILPINLQS